MTKVNIANHKHHILVGKTHDMLLNAIKETFLRIVIKGSRLHKCHKIILTNLVQYSHFNIFCVSLIDWVENNYQPFISKLNDL